MSGGHPLSTFSLRVRIALLEKDIPAELVEVDLPGRARFQPEYLSRTKFKNTPLQAALLSGQYETAKLLLERGADPLVRQAKGFTPLQEAALLGRRDLVDLLLEHGAEINSRADDGRTAVTVAIRARHPEMAEYLRSKGGRGAEVTADLGAAPE